MAMEPCRRHGEWCRNHPNVATWSQRSNIVGKSQQTLSLGEAIKGMGESNFGGSKFVCRARV